MNAWGRSYSSQSEVSARIAEIEADNARWGESDDRVCELDALRALATVEYTVVKDSYTVPCDHMACEVMHRHLVNVRYDRPRYETVYDLQGNPRQMEVEGWHELTRTFWAVLRNGEYVDQFPTRREALAHARAM